jgi:DNA polymerase
MPDLFLDIETRSGANLRSVGAWKYSVHPTTEVVCLCYTIDGGEVQTWINQRLLDPDAPEQPVPEPFLAAHRDPESWNLIAHGDFDRAVFENAFIPKHGFPTVPVKSWHCSMTLALANAYPAKEEILAKALNLPYEKDREGLVLMRQMSRPRKPRKGEDKSILHWLFDAEKLARLIKYCAQDVRLARAIWNHPKLKPLNADERRYQILDAIINQRGVRGDRELTTSARDMAVRERKAINAALQEHTGGRITSVDQTRRILAYANERGHAMTSTTKRSVSAVLAGEPDEETRKVLELRRDGARASVHKYERILAYANETDDRMRGTMRMYGAGPGRWAGRGPQLQNLKKNETNIPLAAVDAVRAGDRAQLRQYGNPLDVLSMIGRATVCAASGYELMAGDFGAIESRVLAWLSGETWKLDAFYEFDRTHDTAKEPYRITAARMLQRDDAGSVTKEERNAKGKPGDLACGFGGSIGAWRRIAGDNERTDDEILIDVRAWRTAHPKTVKYWRELARAIRIAIRGGQPTAAGKIIASFENGNLYLTLPSGRRITYPQARLVPGKYEDSDPDVEFMDNAKGKWAKYRGWFGTFIENIVQGCARDLLAAAVERFEARGISVVLTVHDEVITEVPIGSISDAEYLATLLEPPSWAEGLPLAGKAWSGSHYLEPPEEPSPAPQPPSGGNGNAAPEPPTQDQPAELVEAILADMPLAPEPATTSDEELLADLDDTIAPLFDLVGVPLTDSHTTQCPFHPDEEPSLKFYADHFHCYGCGEHGDRVDWLTRGEGMSREEAIALIRDWDGPVVPRRPLEQDKTARALELWAQGVPIAGTIAERYLREIRKIDLTGLPADISENLRFLAGCPFGAARQPCLIALMRHVATNAPIGIHRVALSPEVLAGGKVERRALGRMGAVKLWPAHTRLVVGEGIETVLAAALMVPDEDGRPLRPAWSLVLDLGIERLPEALLARMPALEELIVLVDNDPAGRAAAATCAADLQRLCRCRCRLLTPPTERADFNDIAKELAHAPQTI